MKKTYIALLAACAVSVMNISPAAASDSAANDTAVAAAAAAVADAPADNTADAAVSTPAADAAPASDGAAPSDTAVGAEAASGNAAASTSESSGSQAASPSAGSEGASTSGGASGAPGGSSAPSAAASNGGTSGTASSSSAASESAVSAAETRTVTYADDQLALKIAELTGKPEYKTAYDAIVTGGPVGKGTKNDTGKTVQEVLTILGREIKVDGSVGDKTLAALSEVQSVLGLPAADQIDAPAFLELLKAALICENEEGADALQAEAEIYCSDNDEYLYIKGCAHEVEGKYYSAMLDFESSGFGNSADRAAACVQAWPESSGYLYKDIMLPGGDMELILRFNNDPDNAMYAKVYNEAGECVLGLFVKGGEEAGTYLPGGTYTIKSGSGRTWYGTKEAFGKDAYYEIMTFDGGAEQVTLESGFAYTITVNVTDTASGAEGIGAVETDWETF